MLTLLVLLLLGVRGEATSIPAPSDQFSLVTLLPVNGLMVHGNALIAVRDVEVSASLKLATPNPNTWACLGVPGENWEIHEEQCLAEIPSPLVNNASLPVAAEELGNHFFIGVWVQGFLAAVGFHDTRVQSLYAAAATFQFSSGLSLIHLQFHSACGEPPCLAMRANPDAPITLDMATLRLNSSATCHCEALDIESYNELSCSPCDLPSAGAYLSLVVDLVSEEEFADDYSIPLVAFRNVFSSRSMPFVASGRFNLAQPPTISLPKATELTDSTPNGLGPQEFAVDSLHVEALRPLEWRAQIHLPLQPQPITAPWALPALIVLDPSVLGSVEGGSFVLNEEPQPLPFTSGAVAFFSIISLPPALLPHSCVSQIHEAGTLGVDADSLGSYFNFTFKVEDPEGIRIDSSSGFLRKLHLRSYRMSPFYTLRWTPRPNDIDIRSEVRLSTWLGLGISAQGLMAIPPSDAVAIHPALVDGPLSNVKPAQVNLRDRALTGIEVDSLQDIYHHRMYQDGLRSYLRFARAYTTGDPTDRAIFRGNTTWVLFAHGRDNYEEFHGGGFGRALIALSSIEMPNASCFQLSFDHPFPLHCFQDPLVPAVASVIGGYVNEQLPDTLCSAETCGSNGVCSFRTIPQCSPVKASQRRYCAFHPAPCTCDPRFDGDTCMSCAPSLVEKAPVQSNITENAALATVYLGASPTVASIFRALAADPSALSLVYSPPFQSSVNIAPACGCDEAVTCSGHGTCSIPGENCACDAGFDTGVLAALHTTLVPSSAHFPAPQCSNCAPGYVKVERNPDRILCVPKALRVTVPLHPNQTIWEPFKDDLKYSLIELTQGLAQVDVAVTDISSLQETQLLQYFEQVEVSSNGGFLIATMLIVNQSAEASLQDALEALAVVKHCIDTDLIGCIEPYNHTASLFHAVFHGDSFPHAEVIPPSLLRARWYLNWNTTQSFSLLNGELSLRFTVIETDSHPSVLFVGVLRRRAWMGLAISDSGMMIGPPASQAAVAIPSFGVIREVKLQHKSPDGIVLDAQDNIEEFFVAQWEKGVNGSLAFSDASGDDPYGRTLYIMRRPLNTSDPSDTQIPPSDVFTLLASAGGNNTLGDPHTQISIAKISLVPAEYTSIPLPPRTSSHRDDVQFSVQVGFYAHAAFMGLVFLLILPFVSVLPRYCRGRQTKDGRNSWWFKRHRTFASIALVLALFGMNSSIFAVHNDPHRKHANSIHSILGFVCLLLLTVQFGAGHLRPRNTVRSIVCWAMYHRWQGTLLLLLGHATLLLGVWAFTDILSIRVFAPMVIVALYASYFAFELRLRGQGLKRKNPASFERVVARAQKKCAPPSRKFRFRGNPL